MILNTFVVNCPHFPFRFEVGFSLGCEVMIMKVCAESMNTASTDWMPPIALHCAL